MVERGLLCRWFIGLILAQSALYSLLVSNLRNFCELFLVRLFRFVKWKQVRWPCLTWLVLAMESVFDSIRAFYSSLENSNKCSLLTYTYTHTQDALTRSADKISFQILVQAHPPSLLAVFGYDWQGPKTNLSEGNRTIQIENWQILYLYVWSECCSLFFLYLIVSDALNSL